MNKNTFKEFNKHLCSYFFILFIPIIILNICYQHYVLDLYKTEILKQDSTNLYKLQIYFDNKVDLLHKITNDLVRFPYFSSHYLSQNASAFYDIFAELNAAKSLDPTILDIYYYNKTNPYTLYSCSGTYNMTTYPQINPNFLKPYIDFEEKLDTIHMAHFQSTADNILLSSQSAIEYIIPIHNQSAFFVFRINPNFFSETLSAIHNPDYTPITYIHADNYSLYTNAPDNFSLNLHALPKLDSSHIQTAYDNPYYINQVTSPFTNLTYRSIINEKLLLSKVKQLSYKFIFLNMLILIVGFILIFFLTHKYYKPIKRLLLSLDSFNFTLPTHLHSLDKVAIGINLLDSDNRRLSYEKCFLKLLSGTYKTIQGLNEDPFNKDILLHHSTFQIITLNYPSSYTLTSQDNHLLKDKNLLALDYIDFYCLDHASHNMYVFIVFYENNLSFALKENLILLQNTLTSHLSTSFSLCVSNEYNDLSAMPYALLECSELAQDTNTINKNSLLFYAETLLGDQATFYYPETELSGLQDAITSYNLEKVEFFINALMDYINSLHDYHPLFLPLTYTIIHTLKKSAKTLNISLSPSLNIPLYPTNSFSKEYSINTINTLTKKILSIIRLHTQTSASLSIQTIVSYIDQHYCEYDLSVSSLADHFNLSVSNLSHQFTTATGVNLSTYINSLRIEEAKTLLRTTSMTVAEISLTVGYTQASSFIRRFKQFTSITPGEFRTQKR